LQVPREVTQAEIDDAIVACLRIFAARGRALRQQREKLANAQGASESAPCIPDALDQTASHGEARHEQAGGEESVKDLG
jgi:hypothetical protein